MSETVNIAALQQENTQLIATVASLTSELDSTKDKLGSIVANLTSELDSFKQQLDSHKQQLDWFQRQLFGRKSEKRLEFDAREQGNLLFGLGVEAPPEQDDIPTEKITYQRRKKQRAASVNDSGLRFDASVPVTTIHVTDPQIAAIPEADRQVIAEKVSYRLAQEPGSYRVLKYIRQVVKRRDTGKLVTAAAAPNVLEKSAVDVSFLAAMLVDKFRYHLPLYRQHQRLQDSGIKVSRGSLTNWAGRAIDLLEPIVQAQAAHVLQSEVLAMDETSIKAGRTAPGKMRQAYFWPVYGDQDEIVFHYAPTRQHRHVETFLNGFKGTLLSDGYAAYEVFAKRHGLSHAQCWSHCRRNFERAQESEPEAVAEVLALIGSLYAHEKIIRKEQHEGAAKRAYRQQHSTPIVAAFFDWCREQCYRNDLLPKSLLAKAIQYARDRETELKVFVDDPRVPIDTNHLERGLRPIPLGRRNWLFAWSEIGAQRIGIIQSLLTTCQLQDVEPYTYLVDVLQRISQHPAQRVIELTPRVWKTLFADQPLRSDLYRAHDPPFP